LGRASDPVLAETFFSNEISDEPFNVWSIPCEVAFFVVRRTYVWVEEELSRLLIGPVVWYSIFLFRIFFDCRDDLF
jgi:hypothetical protein